RRVTKPTLALISPANVGPCSRRSRSQQSPWLLASSSYGNFTLTKTAAVPRFPSHLRHLKIAYENRSSYGDGRAPRRDRTSHIQPTTMNTCLHAHLRGARTWGVRTWPAIAWPLFMLLPIAAPPPPQT